MNLLLLRRGWYRLSLQIAIVAIVGGATAHSCFLGWDSYFGLYLFGAAIIVINATFIGMRTRIIELVAITAMLFFLWVFTRGGFRVYTVDAPIFSAIGTVNAIAVVLLTYFMEFRNSGRNQEFKKQLEMMSEIDTLTGVYNRRFFDNYLGIEQRRHESQTKYRRDSEDDFGVAIIDVDDFKQVNDTHGHLVGDQVLKTLAATMRSVLFERDLLCRYGGEEFVVLFTSTSKKGAMMAIEKILGAVRRHVFEVEENGIQVQVTVSIGYASIEEEPDINRLLDLADRRLYAAKEAGKDRAVGDETMTRADHGGRG